MRARRLTTAATTIAALVAGVAVASTPASAATQSTEVVVSWPSVQPYVGGAPVVQGAVSSRAIRGVLLQQLAGSAWRTVATARTDADGRFALTLPTATPGPRTLRVLVPGTSTDGPTGSAKRGLTVKPSDPRAFAFGSVGRAGDPIARWDPCDGAIGWRVNAAQATAGALADTRLALARITADTGLRFAYRGTTAIVPGAAKAAAYPKDTRLVVAWARPGQSRIFTTAMARGGVAGVGGGSWLYGVVDGKGRKAAQMVKGEVVLDSTNVLEGGFGVGPVRGKQGTRGQLLLHELGHAVGLSHPAGPDTSQIMYPSLSRKLAVYGAGDRNGLKVVGATNGCLTVRRTAASTPVAGVTVAR